MDAPYSRTLADLLFEQAARYGANPAVICGGRHISYEGLAQRAGRIAAGLHQRGVRRGERVGLLMNNRLEWLEVFFGASIVGATVVAFSTWSKRSELEWLLGDADVRVLFTLDRFGEQGFADDLDAILPTLAVPPHVVMFGESGISGVQPYAEFGHNPSQTLPRPPGEGPSAVDDAIIIYTSGSSSRPKSVPLAHYGIIENGFNIGERQGYQPGDRVLLAPPLFWSYGSANAMSATLTHGATLVLQSRFEAGEALDLIERHRCTALYTLPAITAALVSHRDFRPERTKSLRTGVTIGAPQDILTAARVLGAAEICNVYGQTESYGNCCVTPHHWPLERRAQCQGPPLPGVQLRIVHPETGAELPLGEDGLIEVRGYVTSGYGKGNEELTASAFADDGFFRTGDMGHRTESGELVFVGRTTEMIKKGGINISPAEVEDVLMRHPAVGQAGVVGIQDARQGELLAAFIILRPGQHASREEIAAHCRSVAATYKVPDIIEFRNDLPVTATGKLMRRELKQLATAATEKAGAS
jgi:fatty-acyl-CoA synthase